MLDPTALSKVVGYGTRNKNNTPYPYGGSISPPLWDMKPSNPNFSRFQILFNGKTLKWVKLAPTAGGVDREELGFGFCMVLTPLPILSKWDTNIWPLLIGYWRSENPKFGHFLPNFKNCSNTPFSKCGLSSILAKSPGQRGQMLVSNFDRIGNGVKTMQKPKPNFSWSAPCCWSYLGLL